MIQPSKNAFSFGEFVLNVDRRLLLRNGEVVHLKAKAFDVLLTLIENRGEVLSKNQLMDIVWENQFVEENNLTVHITALRKALGERKNEHRYIVTVPGKGYRFIGEVDKPANGEVIISERRTLEKIIVDEEFVEQLSDDLDPDPLSLPSSPTETRPPAYWRTAVVFAGIALAIAGVVGVSYFRGSIGAGFLAGTVPFKDHQLIQLTTNGKVGNAAISPDGKSFAYVVDDVGMKSLWIGNVDGGNHLQLKPAAEATYYELAFAPDSSQFYYSVSDTKNPAGALYTVPAMGGVSTKLKDNVEDFAMAPDGRRIAWVRKDPEAVVVVVSALDGSGALDVASFPKNQPYLSDSISWSSDGARLALSVERPGRIYRHELCVIEVATGGVTRISLERFREITKTSWLQDGSGLIITAIEETSHSSVPQYRLVHVTYPEGVANAITTDRSNYGASWHNDSGATLSLDRTTNSMLAVEHRQLSNVWLAPAEDLSAARQITFSSFGRYDGLWGLDWTPDGKLIYTTSDTQNQYLAAMNSDGSEQRPLTAPVGSQGHVDSVLTVSSDGRYIIFHSNRVNGEFDIWRADIDGSNPKQLSVGGKNFIPTPSPDGKWVYYKSWLDDIGRLCRVPIDGGAQECFSEKETTWVCFSPDGNYFAASYITDKPRLAIFSAKTHEVLRQFDLPKTGTMYMGSRWTADSRSITYRDNSHGYWIQPIEGGEPSRLEGLPRERLYNFSWSRDGKLLAFVRGQEIRDVVLFRRAEE